MVPVFKGTQFGMQLWQRKQLLRWLFVPAMLALAVGLCLADLASGQPFGPEVTVSLSAIALSALFRDRRQLYGVGIGLMLIALLLAVLWMLHPVSSNNQTRLEVLCDSALLIMAACLLTLGIDAWQQRAHTNARLALAAPVQTIRAIAAPKNLDVRMLLPAPDPIFPPLEPALPILQSAQALPAALHTYASDHYGSNGALPTFNTLWDEPALPLTHVNMLFQFALGALRERSAHTSSGGLEVSIIATPHAAWIDVQDDGTHFSEQELTLPVALYRECAERLGGSLEILSGNAPRNALRLRVAIPQRYEPIRIGS